MKLLIKVPKSDYHKNADKLVVCEFLCVINRGDGSRCVVLYKHRFLGLLDATVHHAHVGN